MMEPETRVPAPKLLAHIVAAWISRETLAKRSSARGTPRRGWRVKQGNDYMVTVYWEPGRNATNPYGADDLLDWNATLAGIERVEQRVNALARKGRARRIFINTRRNEVSEWSVSIEGARYMPTKADMAFSDDD